MPTLKLKQLYSKAKPNEVTDVFPLSHGRCHLFFSGRYALAAGIKALGLKPDDNVLIPSYQCWVRYAQSTSEIKFIRK